VIRVADIKEEKRIMAQPATKPTIDQDLKKWIEQVYPVFSELPEGKYLWAVGIIPKGFGPFWSLMSVNANAGPAEMTIDLDGVTVKGKPGAKGDGWRHVCKIGDARHNILSDGVEYWLSVGGRFLVLKIADHIEDLNEELWNEAGETLERLRANDLLTVTQAQ
jgi:hypothetical protein